MGTDPQSTSAPPAPPVEDGTGFRDQLPSELGGNAAPPDPPSAAPESGLSLHYCSVCWSALPPAVTECPDCGVSVAQMEASRRKMLEMDRSWTPPRRAAETSAAAEPTSGVPAAQTPAAPPRSRLEELIDPTPVVRPAPSEVLPDLETALDAGVSAAAREPMGVALRPAYDTSRRPAPQAPRMSREMAERVQMALVLVGVVAFIALAAVIGGWLGLTLSPVPHGGR